MKKQLITAAMTAITLTGLSTAANAHGYGKGYNKHRGHEAVKVYVDTKPHYRHARHKHCNSGTRHYGNPYHYRYVPSSYNYHGKRYYQPRSHGTFTYNW